MTYYDQGGGGGGGSSAPEIIVSSTPLSGAAPVGAVLGVVTVLGVTTTYGVVAGSWVLQNNKDDIAWPVVRVDHTFNTPILPFVEYIVDTSVADGTDTSGSENISYVVLKLPPVVSGDVFRVYQNGPNDIYFDAPVDGHPGGFDGGGNPTGVSQNLDRSVVTLVANVAQSRFESFGHS